MCGIVGYVGPKAVIPLLVGGLEKLEYRGYDSAGVAVVNADRQFEIHRSVGKLGNLKDKLNINGSLGSAAVNGALNIGIGHTRWATHGKPSETNAHPHVAGNVCVVHNGIIENYRELRAELEKKGCDFASETDTEIAAHLINSFLTAGTPLLTAVTNAVAKLEGSYALVVISKAEPDKIVVAKNSTPVIIGLSKNENFIASDIPAVLEYTREVVILEDGEIAEVTRDKITLIKDGEAHTPKPMTVTWDPITAEKGGYRHFMLKEIHEQPQAVTDTVRGRIDQEACSVFLDDVLLTPEELKAVKRVCIVACGTAWHAAQVTKFYIESMAKIPVEVDYGSEFRYREPLVDSDTLYIAISQSGETADTLGSLKLATQRGAKTVAICNVLGSSISRLAKNVLYTHAGPEISVASTKAFVTQLTAGYLLALHLGSVRGTLEKEKLRGYLDDLVHLPVQITEALNAEPKIEELARKYIKAEDYLFLGRGILYPIALEGALKLKEISYLHAEGYPAGEMKHGPIALIDDKTPVVAILGHDGVNYEKAISNLKEVESRGGKVIAFTDIETPQLKELADEVIALGKVSPLLQPIVFTIPVQLLAYYVAVHRGTDVDQPRNLAKSVTVE